MLWGDIRRLVLAAIGGLAAVALLVMFVDPGLDMATRTLGVPFGLIIPLVSAAIIAGVAWFLLSQAPRRSDGPDRYHVVACSSCGRAVLTDWRLCPYCGSAMNPGAASPDAPARG